MTEPLFWSRSEFNTIILTELSIHCVGGDEELNPQNEVTRVTQRVAGRERERALDSSRERHTNEREHEQ